MAKVVVGRMNVILAANTGKFSKGMDRAKNSVGRFSAGISKVATKVAKFGAVMAAAAVGGMGLLLKSTLSTIDATAKPSNVSQPRKHPAVIQVAPRRIHPTNPGSTILDASETRTRG